MTTQAIAFWLPQLGIAIFGVLAIWLSQSQSYEARKWASVAGLIGQPFWFWASYTSEQWGILALSVAYSAAWSRGFWTYWIKGAE